MEATILTMCQSALAHDDGDLSILGAWDIFKVPEVPAVIPACALAARVSFDQEDDGDHAIGYRIIDRAGNVVTSQDGIGISLDVANGVHPTSSVPLVAQLFNIEFQQDGPHAIVLTFDGQDRIRSQFYIAVEPA